MKRLILAVALCAFAPRAYAEDILETPPAAEGSVHVAHYVGVSGASGRSPSFAAGTSVEFRTLFAQRIGLGVVIGGELNEFDTTFFGGGGPRLRLTNPASSLDITLGYDLRVMRLREWLVIFGPTPQPNVTVGHALTLRFDGPMSPSGALRVGGYAEVGIAHDGLGRWGSLGLSVGFSGRQRR